MSTATKKFWPLALVLSSGFGVLSAGSARAVPPDPPHDPPLPLPISFSVDRGAEGIPTTPNDVFSLGPLGLNLPTEGEVFQSSGAVLGLPPDTTNIDRMPAALEGTFGLVPGDNIISLSYGLDSGNVLQFSVDPLAIGLPSTDVNFEALRNEAAGDIFKSVSFNDFGSYIEEHIAAGHILSPANPPPNDLYRDDLELGLQAPDPVEDDLDALEEADTGDPFWGVDVDGDGAVDPGKFAFFSLDAASPSVGVASTSDILVSPGADIFAAYASGVVDIGLQANDVLDALALSDVGSAGRPNGLLDIGADEALFSLQANSPTLGALGLSPGDVFYTDFTGKFSLYASATDLGLEFDDELNALDIKPVPEPTAILGLLALGTLGAGSALKRKLKQ